VLERDCRELIELKLEKFRRKLDRIEPSYQGDMDYEDLLEETVEDLLHLVVRVAGEGVGNA
jgi:hypothetical protein